MGAALAGSGVLAACGGQAGQSGGAPGAPKALSGEVTWFMRSQNQELPWEQGAVQAFKQEAPNVTVNLETVSTTNDFDPKLTALIAGGTPPDVWTHWGTSGFGDYYAKGLLADLTPLASRDKLDAGVFMPNTYDAWKRDGKLYGLSFNTRFGTFVYWNKQLFQQAGLQPPPVDWEDRSWTWDKMVEAAQKITATGQGFGINFGAQPGLWGLAYLFGGDFFKKEQYEKGVAKESNIGAPEVLAGVSARADLHNKLRVAPRSADIQASGARNSTDMFSLGKLGMLFDTGSEWPTIDKGAKIEWAVAAVPRAKDNKVVNFLNPLMLSRDSKNKDTAWAFMKWNVSEAGQRLLVQNGFQPVHKALLDEWLTGGSFKQSQADVKKAIDGAAPHGQISPNQLFADFAPVRTAVDEALGPVWQGDKSAADGLRDAKTKVDSLLADTYSRYGAK